MASDRLEYNTAVELIARRRRQVLVHSALYYRMNENIVGDHVYDAWTKELAELQVLYPEAAAEASHAEAFAAFDGSTGFDLPYNVPDIISRATHLLNYHRKAKREAPVNVLPSPLFN